MSIIVIAGLSLVATAASVPVMYALARTWRLERPNFRGAKIPAGFGFLTVLAAAPIYAAMLVTGAPAVRIGAYLAAVVGFGVLGLLDDIHGTREVGGFRGHLSLLRKGKVSTGLMKAVGGGILGLCLGAAIAGFDPATGLLNGVLIGLSANTLNLLDLRPGRAVSCFWVGILAVAATHYRAQSDWWELIPVMIPAAWLTVLDRSARIMLGDAGSNVLGAVLGVALACSLDFPAKLLIVFFMVGVNVYSEKYSISKLIEGNRLLRSVDRLLGVR